LKDLILNTTELIDALAEANELSKAKSKEIVASLFSIVVDAAKKGDDVVVTGFGRFTLKERPEREGRNPATGAALKIAASKSIAFKMAKSVGTGL
jgi:DNA-binding protein HU-beta